MNPSLDRSPRRWMLIVLALLALAGLVIGIRLFTVAFPEASIEFKISRSEASAQASDLLTRMGHQPAGYREAIVFDYDELTKTYLEREIGLEKSSRLMQSDISVWRWKYRRFRPLQKEEFYVFLDTSGRLVGYQHLIEEARKGPALESARAREVAEAFLRETVKLPLDRYALVEERSLERPERRDHVLTWERKEFKAGDATYRAQVTLQGGEVGGYDEYLKIPESWQRDFQEMRSHNNLLQNAATVLFVLLFLAMLVVLFARLQRGQGSWRLPLALGGAMFVLQFLQGLNQLPLWLMEFSTTSTLGSFVVSSIGLIFLEALGTALLVFVPAAAGEPLYRRYFPSKLSLENLFSRSAAGTAEFARGSVVGYLFVLVHFGFITAFYYYGRSFGFWSPADVNYTNAVSTAIPWITPLALSFNASLFEEFTFRLFAIPFFKRYLRSTWLAIVLPAFLWGFLHSAYPQQPSYVRGLEVGLIGVVAGWLMVRFGIWATLVWHYVVDAFLIGLFLFRSSSLYFQVSGAIVVGGLLVPLAVAVFVRMKRGSFTDPQPWTNASVDAARLEAAVAVPAAEEIAVPPEEIRQEAPGVVPPQNRFRPAALGLLALAGIAAMLLLRVERFGEFAEYRIGAEEAGRSADTLLRSMGVNPESFRKNTELIQLVSDMQSTYIYRQEGIRRLNQAYAADLPALLWKTRYFRPLDKEEYWISFTIGGNFYNYRHLMDEKAPGDSPSREEALSRAIAYLRKAKGIDVSSWKLVNSEIRKRDARTDFEFEWEREREGIGEARFRVGVGVLGEEVQGFQSYLKLPESWELKERETTIQRALISHSPTALGVGIFVLILVLFVVHLRSGLLKWKRPMIGGSIMTLGILLLYANSLSTVIGQYQTQFQYQVFWATMVLVFLILLLMAAAGISMLLSLTQSMWESSSAWLLSRSWNVDSRRRFIAAGLLGGYALSLGLGGLSRLLGYCIDKLNIRTSTPVLSVLESAGDSWPLLGILIRAALMSSIGLALAICVVVFLSRFIRPRNRQLLLIAAGIILASGGTVRTAADFLIPLVATALTVLLLYLVFRFWIGWNPIALGACLFLRALGGEVLQMIRQPDAFLRWNGIAGAVLWCAPILVALYFYRRADSEPDIAPVEVIQ